MSKHRHTKPSKFTLHPLEECLDSLAHHYIYHGPNGPNGQPAAISRYVLPMSPPNPDIPSGMVAIFITSDPEWLAKFAALTDDRITGTPLAGRFNK